MRTIQLILLFLYFQNLILPQGIDHKYEYSKQEVQIKMRDGVKLYTIVYSPIDSSEKHPILITRTPYSCGPYGKEQIRKLPTHLAEEKYIFVYQDVRGKYMSEGNYVNVRPFIPIKKEDDIDESSDTYDTIEWLLKQTYNNGNVGIYGISYPGFYAAMALNESHPALKAVSPQAPIADWFVGDDMHHNGAFSLSLAYVFFASFGRERNGLTTLRNEKIVELKGDSYNYFLDIGPLKNVNENYFFNKISFWNDLMEHGRYNEFWTSRNTLNHFNEIKPAVMTVGGWYDNEDLYGAINTYKEIEKKNEVNQNILVVGPWYHGGWSRSTGNVFGDMNFGSNTSEFYREEIEKIFFNYYLKNSGKNNLPEAYIFETGKNKWRKYNEWPPKNSEVLSIYFCDKNKLVFEKERKSEFDFNKYISDPYKPVPYTAEPHPTRRMYNRTYMVEDQRFASVRDDVLSFETDPLKSDLTIAGPIEADLFVSTSGSDSDWIVKLIDVFPDSVTPDNLSMSNYQMLVRGEIMRGKFRNSLSDPEPFQPNKVERIRFTLNDSHHTFLKGHRIMVQIQSSWFPLFDRNPQTYCDIYNADSSDFRKATNRIYHSDRLNSRIILRVLEK